MPLLFMNRSDLLDHSMTKSDLQIAS